MSASPTLPPHARVIAAPDVWLATAAVDQLARIAAEPGCRRAVGLPDLHPGRGIPIGAAFAFEGVIHPRLVGGDAGCGVRLTALRKLKYTGDALLRRLEAATEGPALPDCDPTALLAAIWTRGPRGLAELDGVPATLAALAAAEPDSPADDPLPDPGPAPTDPTYAEQLGTVGGGNHFVELSRVEQVTDKPAAKALGLSPGCWVVLAHSGSRGLGGAFARDWHAHPLTAPADQTRYRAALAAVLRYAATNRLVLSWRLLDAVGAARPSKLAGQLDLVHNTVVPAALPDAPHVWLHRKGAAPAESGTPTVVLGSRGAPTHVMLGAGRPETLWSVAHGAGRKMHRSEAVAKVAAKHRKDSLTRTPHGGHVFCDDKQLLFAEHPDAYKPIDPVIASLEADGAARRVATLLPFATFKR